MSPRVLLGVGVGVALLASVAVVAGGRSLLARVRDLPGDLAAAYRERETELRTALLPDEAEVIRARADVARRRTARGTVPSGGATEAAGRTEDDDLAEEW